MPKIEISEVGIDDQGRTYVCPREGDYELVYRAAMEVYWDRELLRLSHPHPPRGWSPVEWYRQIISAVADEFGTRLVLSPRTKWKNVPSKIRGMIEMEGEAPQ